MTGYESPTVLNALHSDAGIAKTTAGAEMQSHTVLVRSKTLKKRCYVSKTRGCGNTSGTAAVAAWSRLPILDVGPLFSSRLVHLLELLPYWSSTLWNYI
jgi:hypothetical protein